MDNIGLGFTSRVLPRKAMDYARAPIHKRAIAFAIDILLLNFLIVSPFQTILMRYFEGMSFADFQTVLPASISFSISVIAIIALLYFSLLQHYSQQTIGMMVMRLYVVPQIGLFRAIVRNLFILPFFPFSVLWVIEPVALVWKKRRVLEKLTATNTVEVFNG